MLQGLVLLELLLLQMLPLLTHSQGTQLVNFDTWAQVLLLLTLTLLLLLLLLLMLMLLLLLLLLQAHSRGFLLCPSPSPFIPCLHCHRCCCGRRRRRRRRCCCCCCCCWPAASHRNKLRNS